LTLPEHSTVADALEMLPIPPEEIGMTAVGGEAVKRDRFLSDGDRLKIYPPIIGG